MDNPQFKHSTRKRLDDYLVSASEIERVTGESILVENYLKYDNRPVLG